MYSVHTTHCPGAGVDSYYEYLAKGSSLLNRPELIKMFRKLKPLIFKNYRAENPQNFTRKIRKKNNNVVSRASRQYKCKSSTSLSKAGYPVRKKR